MHVCEGMYVYKCMCVYLGIWKEQRANYTRVAKQELAAFWKNHHLGLSVAG